MLLELLLMVGACKAERGVRQGLPASVKAEIAGETVEVAPCAVSSIPEPVRRAIAGGERELTMADPGQEWNSTDVGRAGLPTRQLVRAVHSNGTWVVDFWKGGFALTYRVVVVRVDGDDARVLWQGQGRGGAAGGKGGWRCE
jgi:hypothetical protein